MKMNILFQELGVCLDFLCVPPLEFLNFLYVDLCFFLFFLFTFSYYI